MQATNIRRIIIICPFLRIYTLRNYRQTLEVHLFDILRSNDSV